MIVNVDLSPYEIWQIETEAERRGVPLVQFIRDAAVALVGGNLATDPLRELHALGMCDADIGTQLGISSAAVVHRRKRLGLVAHRRYPKRNKYGIAVPTGAAADDQELSTI